MRRSNGSSNSMRRESCSAGLFSRHKKQGRFAMLAWSSLAQVETARAGLNCMKTTLLVVGKTVEKHYITIINDYTERVKHYISFDIEVIPELKNTKSLTQEQQKEKEGELILKALQPGDTVVLLDEGGKEFRSVEFASWMERKLNTVNKRLVFVIGGPYGFSPSVYAATSEKLSLSKMTFSHQMIRILFVEQLYRAMNILNGGAYHHE